MKSAKQLKELAGEKIAQLEALHELAATEEREFTAEEQTQFDGWMAELGNDGTNGEAKSGIYAQIDRAQEFERLVASKTKPSVDEAPKAQPAQARRHRKLKAFNDAQDAYNCGLWLKGMLGDKESAQAAKEKGIYAAQTGSTDSAGGYTVPDTWSDAIINVFETSGVAPMVCRSISMPSDVLNVPKRVSGQTVYYPAQAAAITASDKTYGTIALSAVKRAVLTQVANELIADSLIDVVDDVAMEAGHQLALQADEEFIVGDGSGSYGSVTGLVDSCGAAGTHGTGSGDTAFTDITLSDLHTVQSLVAEKFWDESRMCWIMRRSTWESVVRPLLYAAGGNTVDSLTGGSRPMLMGYPVYFTDKMPASAVSTFGAFFGNFYEAALMGVRQNVEIATSMDYGFNLDALSLRVLTRYDLNVHESPGSGSSYGAYAGIQTAAS